MTGLLQPVMRARDDAVLRNLVGVPIIGGPIPFVLVDLTTATLDPRITYTRSTTKTYFDSTGIQQTAGSNTAPLEYDPVSLALLGRSWWDARTNLLVGSNDFTIAAGQWMAETGTTTVAASGIAPDGSNTAWLFTPAVLGNAPGVTATTSNRMFNEPPAASTNVAYTISLYVQAASGTTAAGLYVVNGATDTIVSSTLFTANGTRQLVTVTGTTTGTNTNKLRVVFSSSQACLISWCQPEAGTTASNYIATTTVVVQRAGDAGTITSLAAVNLSPTAGTIWVEAIMPPATNASAINTALQLSDGTGSNFLAATMVAAGALRNRVYGPTAQQAQNDLGTQPYGTTIRMACSYGPNGFSACVNGGTVVTTATGTMPVVTEIDIGRAITASRAWNGYVRKLRFYAAPLPTATLQSSTV